MADNVLTKHQKVLHLGTETMGYVEFDPPVGDDSPFVTLDQATWAAMGRPHDITVTVELGDQLNT